MARFIQADICSSLAAIVLIKAWESVFAERGGSFPDNQMKNTKVFKNLNWKGGSLEERTRELTILAIKTDPHILNSWSDVLKSAFNESLKVIRLDRRFSDVSQERLLMARELAVYLFENKMADEFLYKDWIYPWGGSPDGGGQLECSRNNFNYVSLGPYAPGFALGQVIFSPDKVAEHIYGGPLYHLPVSSSLLDEGDVVDTSGAVQRVRVAMITDSDGGNVWEGKYGVKLFEFYVHEDMKLAVIVGLMINQAKKLEPLGRIKSKAAGVFMEGVYKIQWDKISKKVDEGETRECSFTRVEGDHMADYSIPWYKRVGANNIRVEMKKNGIATYRSRILLSQRMRCCFASYIVPGTP